MLAVLIEIELDAVDYQDAAAFGLSKFSDIETDTQDIQSRLPAALVDGRIVANAQVVGDKTGFKLAADGLAMVTAWTVDITGNLTGSVGSISGVTFPANFASMVINANNGHVAVVVHAVQAGAYTDAAFSPNWFTAAGLASDAATEIATAVGALQVLVDMGVMIINDGTANARFSISALQNGPAGEGGAVINVYPVSASTPERVAGTTITYYRNEIRTVSVVTDFTLTSLTLSFTVEDSEGTDLLTIPDGSISRSDKTFTVSIGTSVTAKPSNYRWALRDITGGTNSVIARGVLTVQEAASA